MSTCHISGLVLAGTASNTGKTTVAIALAAALKARGISVQPAKAGPDYLDAAWLAKAAGRACPNLDIWMARDSSAISSILGRFARSGDFVLAEGAMGLYDGDANGRASTAALAESLGLPVLLLLNAKGMGQSVAAMASGFLGWCAPGIAKKPHFCGIICVRTGSPRHEKILAKALEPVCREYGVPFLGCLPVKDAPCIPSRHLGLTQSCEMDIDEAKAGEWLASHVDVDLLLCQTAKHAMPIKPAVPARRRASAGPVTAIARDAAFAFCYADLPLLLEELGAYVVYFSPLHDNALPKCDAIYFPGGYPELYARELEKNGAMLVALREMAADGMPIYGECGGYIYLMDRVYDTEGRPSQMAGLLRGEARLDKCLAALGYRAAKSLWLGSGLVYGHEFHYAKAAGESGEPLWRLSDAVGSDLGTAGQRKGNVAGSWVHLYPFGSHAFWREWVDLARRWRKGNA